MSNIVEYNRNKAMSIKTAPSSYAEMWNFAKMIAASEFAPKCYRGRPENVMIAAQWGAEIGMAIMQSVQSISVINGKPSLYGDSMLAIVKGSGLLEYKRETFTKDEAICLVKRVGSPDEVVRTFSIEDAKTANLWKKAGPWSQYPKRMLQMRARAWALRDEFPDVLMGIYSAEEAMDIPAEDVTPPRFSRQEPQITEPAVEDVEAEDVPETLLATKEQKDLIVKYCDQAKFSSRDFGNEMLRDFDQKWDEMTEVVAAQMIERLGIRIQEMEGKIA